MIKSLHIRNYKCLRDVRVELKPFTVVIGKNDTGKSSLLEAIRTLATTVSPSPQTQAAAQTIDKLVFRGADPQVITWSVEIDPSPRNHLPGAATYSLSVSRPSPSPVSLVVERESVNIAGLSAQIEWRSNEFTLKEGEVIQASQAVPHLTALSWARHNDRFPGLRAVARALSTTTKYRLDPAKLAEPTAYDFDPDTPDSEPKLHHDGSGLASVLDYLLGAKRSSFDAIERELRDAVPFVKSIQLRPWRSPKGEMGKSISFELSAGGHEIQAPLASDGVMLFLAYLTLIHSPNAPAIMLIEEPENGVHPRQLQRIAEYLKRLTNPARGTNAVQIILATHSPYFLDFVPPEDVLVFGRRANGETVTAPILSLPGVQERIESGFSLGEMWFNVGEDRLLAELLA